MSRVRIAGIFVGSLVAVASFGCAQERDPINRVQANALAKSFFVGQSLQDPTDDPEFYKRDTVVDVGYGAGADGLFTSTYAQPVSRIKWEIAEETINARLSYERVKGSDGKGNVFDGLTPKATNDGQIVASFRIQSHFDIRRDYNPQTGEELNVVAENGSDRPWYDREYFRVDWSQNLVTDAYDFDTLSMMGIYGGIQYEPLSYAVLDPASPDAPHFDSAQNYFDVTTKAYAVPQLLDLSSLGWGIDKFPACMLPGEFGGGTQPYGNCNPTEITLRHSFRRVVDKDYEPANVDGVRFQALGNFTTEYRGYQRNYGMLDDQWFRFASRYNIWERSHAYADPASMSGPVACATKETTEDPTGEPTADPNRDANGNGTSDECEAVGPGSRCDIFNRKCTLPYTQRKSVTTPWYLSGDTSETLFEATNWAVQEWDLAMKTAVQTARLDECRKTGGSDCDATYPMYRGQQDDNMEAMSISRDLDACLRANAWSLDACRQGALDAAAQIAAERGVAGDASTLAIGTVVGLDPMIVLCHNPVRGDDSPACGSVGTAPRLGDLRYNLVLNIPKPQQPSAWGIMVDGDDPLTGEKVAASINIWTHVTDIASQTLVDLVRYINGEIPIADITDGKYIQDWATAARIGSGTGMPTMSKADTDGRVASVAGMDPAKFAQAIATAKTSDVKAVLKNMRARVADVAANAGVASPANAKVTALMKSARGTSTETTLLNPAMMQLAGVPSSLPVSGAVADIVSPFGLNNPKVRADMKRMRENGLAARGMCILNEGPEPSGLTGIADALARKFPKGSAESATERTARYQKLFHYIQRKYTYAVIAHEMGHSVGLRHNFVSSAAPMFYRPQYWQLRTKNGTVTRPCTDAVTDGASCVGPRYWDPITDEEQNQLIWMFMQSTVMDYPGDVSQDMIGLGVTDFAAARFYYGDVISTYTSPDYADGSAIGQGVTAATDTFGGLGGVKYSLNGNNFHYSQLQNNYNLISNCYNVTPTAPATWNADIDGVWDQVLDGQIVSVDGQATKCREQQVDYTSWGRLQPATPSTNGRGIGPNVDQNGNLRVPYAFATDNWADTGNVSVFRHDNGADPYEQATFLVTTQENRHIFDNYRRNRSTFNVRAASDRSYQRYNEKLLGLASGMGFIASIYADLAPGQGYSFDSLWPIVAQDQFYDNTIAATVAMDHFTRELSRPEPGPHYFLAPNFHDNVLRSTSDADDFGNAGTPQGAQLKVVVPNGTTGFMRDVGFGGHPIENQLDDTKGDYASEYSLTAGSYYDKINTAILMSESEDRFISQSRRDFYDSRFRATGMADILPDAFRRIVANALTGDRSLLASRVAADNNGNPLIKNNGDPNDDYAPLYPAQALGWTSWWKASGPETCFPLNGATACTNYNGGPAFGAAAPAHSAAIDPQIGWEVQKFLITWTAAHIKANDKTQWIDQMRLYRIGLNSDPALANRIEWQDAVSGQLYYAPTYGTECLFGDAAAGCAGGKVVQKGIAARVVEYANELTAKAYLLDTASYPATATHPAGFNDKGRAMVLRQPDGSPIVVADPAIRKLPSGVLVTCDLNVDPTCAPLKETDNHYAHALVGYTAVPAYLWETGMVFGFFGPPGVRGEY